VILMYQMFKVASRSWVEAAKPAAATEGSVPFHCHYLVPRNLERIQAAFNLPPAQQTIANMLLPRNLLRLGPSVRRQLEAARASHAKIRIVSGMRDPVARSISLIVFLCDFYGHTYRPLSPRVEVSPEYVITVLQDNWRFVLERREPPETFEWLLWYLTDAFRTWFTDELGNALEVDALRGKFQRQDGTQRISTELADILIYRVEDMFPEAPLYARLLEQASTFLGTPLSSFPRVNTSDTRRSREISVALRRQFWLPADMLDAIYGEPAVQHFYDRDEVLAFKRLWSTSGLQNR
jgi:hypothetical protein